MKQLVFVSIACGLWTVACHGAPALEERPSNNPSVPVELLLSHDGCDIFRFHDNGVHYFVRCSEPRTKEAVIERVKCGKGCTRDELIVTTESTGPSQPR